MFSPQFPPVVGGAERQAALLSSALARRGVQVEVLTLRLDRRWPLREVIDPGVVVHRLPYWTPSLHLSRLRGWGLVSLVLLGPRLTRTMSRLAGRIDVVHAHNASAPITAFAVRAARRRGLRVLVKVVNIGKWFDLQRLSGFGWRGRIAARWLREDVDRWIAISQAAGEELCAAGIPPQRVLRIPNGVAIPAQARSLPEMASNFLHLGRLDSASPRDFEGLITAFARAAGPDSELAVVGDGERREELERFAEASSSGAKIRFPGFQDGEIWRAWAHVYVQPSFFEGMSNALLEAMACGLACIAYDIPPNREALADGDAGLLIAPGDHAALAAAIERMATEPGFARHWGERARARAVAGFDVDAVAATLETAYLDLMSHPLSIDAREGAHG
jgi:glycosyltransferase involved in cell wall biosynthesis